MPPAFDRADPETLIVTDPVHGDMELSAISKSIMDTAEFQRLRRIQQLGLTSLVYPGGVETRFTHSVGTAFLGRKLAWNLLRKQPEVNITVVDAHCIEIAGLCHDIGHGPFSHTWEKILSSLNPELRWKHEAMSCRMFHRMLAKNSAVREAFKEAGLGDRDVTFIQELITGRPYSSEFGGPIMDRVEAKDENDNRKEDAEWKFVGRGPEKAFLYEIVSNKRTGIDVDKLDYMPRDSRSTGLKDRPIHPERFIENCRAVNVDGKWELGFLASCEQDIPHLFYRRATLHTKAYQHKTVQVLEQMLVDAFQLAYPHFKLEVNNKVFDLVEASSNPEAYLHLKDDIGWKIGSSFSEDLRPAGEILERIMRRQLYVKYEPSFGVPACGKVDAQELEEKLRALIGDEKLKEEVVVLRVHIKFASDGVGHPVDSVAFIEKDGTIRRGGSSVFKEIILPAESERREFFVAGRSGVKHDEIARALDMLIEAEGLVKM